MKFLTLISLYIGIGFVCYDRNNVCVFFPVLWPYCVTRSSPIGGARRHASPVNLKILQTFCVSLVVILLQTVAELFNPLLAGPVLRTVVQYSIVFCSDCGSTKMSVSGLRSDCCSETHSLVSLEIVDHSVSFS